MTGTYVDANALAYLVHPQAHAKQDAARRSVHDAARRGTAVTSALTIDEVAWAIWREVDQERGIGAGRDALNVPGLRITSVGRDAIDRALELAGRHGLRPRDAIHVAVAQAEGCSCILSDDPDFDVVPGLERIPIQ